MPINRLTELDDESLAASMRWLLGSCGLGGERLWQLNGVRQENEPANLHCIAPGQLAELASGAISADTAQQLREVRLSKHKILVEAVRRSAEWIGQFR